MFTAPDVARYLQDTTGLSLKKIITLLKPLLEVTIDVDGRELVANSEIPETARQILNDLGTKCVQLRRTALRGCWTWSKGAPMAVFKQ